MKRFTVEKKYLLIPICTGEEKNIVFGLTGTGYFDMVAYQKFNDGVMQDYIPTDEDLKTAISKLPKVD